MGKVSFKRHWCHDEPWYTFYYPYTLLENDMSTIAFSATWRNFEGLAPQELYGPPKVVLASPKKKIS